MSSPQALTVLIAEDGAADRLLLATIVLYLIYNWLVGASRLRLS